MATDTNAEAKKNVVRQYMDALNNNDLPALIALMTPDYDDHMTMPGVPTGREGAIFAHKMLESAFPDVHFTIEDLMVDGDRVVVMSTGRGTHKGDFFGLPPTGKTVTWWGIRILRVTDDGKIAEGWALLDQRGILTQLGIIPSGPPSPPPAPEMPRWSLEEQLGPGARPAAATSGAATHPILVTGATGNVGREVVKQLVEAGQPVRVLVRDRAKGEAMFGQYVDIAEGDFDKPETLAAALQGVEHAFLLSPTDPRQVELQGNFIEAAKRAGVQHIVKLSVVGADPEAPAQLMRWHAETEKQLEESGIGWTHLRPHVFYQYWMFLAPSINASGAFYAALKQDVKLAAVDVRDIAAVAVATLTEPGHEGQVYKITGPEGISNAELAQKITEVVGKRVNYVEMPAEMTRQGMLQMGMPEWFVYTVVGMDEAYSSGEYSYVTDVVETVGKRTPITVDQFLAEYGQAFKG